MLHITRWDTRHILMDINSVRDGTITYHSTFMHTMIFLRSPPSHFSESLCFRAHGSDEEFEKLCEGMLERADWLSTHAVSRQHS